MTITIDNEYGDSLGLEIDNLIENAVEATADYLGCPYHIEISVLLTDDHEIQIINQEQRGIEKPTDVLSFPMLEYEEDFTFESLEKVQGAFHPETGELLLGDIIVSMEKVKEQSQNYNHSLKREFTFLIVHSMLHLFGRDHMEESERIIMEKEQAEIMERLKIYR